VCFIIVAFKKEDFIIGIMATMLVIMNKAVDTLFFSEMLKKSSYSNLFFSQINKLYEYANQGHLEAVSNLLDVISPHNVLKITSNPLTRLLLPKRVIGLTINK